IVRILHLIPGLTGGGAERQLTLLALAQSARGHEVHIGVARSELPGSLRGASVHIHQLSSNGNHDPLLLFRIRKLIQSTRADIVQTWLTMMDVAGGVAALSTNTPWLLSERSEAAAYPSTFKNFARVRVGRSANAVVANSTGGVDYWSNAGVSTKKLSLVPNAVDAPAIANAGVAQLPSSLSGKPLVLFVGRLSEEKMPFVLIDALAQVFKTTAAVAIFAGVGPLEQEIRDAIRRHGLENRLVVAGHRDDVFGLMRAASVCVALSRFEGNPNVALEAMSAGCPLVVSDIAGYRQLLDDSTALFVPVSDVDAAARAILAALNNPGTARSRAALAQTRAAQYAPSHIAESFDTVYASLLPTIFGAVS
ncbi:MAG: glycosyltransferase, partial [Gemmatimonadaceae bacterium]